ncbi:MAG: 30S ribosomal protein S6 [Candidatus Omnitrophica bacterium]|nr:30S ribosomal protein S6 [Candidatus Omnitrophota bacterium]
MHNYEGVFILSPDLSADSSKSVITQVEESISKNGGRIDGLQDWGRRRLAYKIKKKQEGHYILLNFQMDSQQTKKFEQALRLNDNILRFLLVNKEGR